MNEPQPLTEDDMIPCAGDVKGFLPELERGWYFKEERVLSAIKGLKSHIEMLRTQTPVNEVQKTWNDALDKFSDMNDYWFPILQSQDGGKK